MKGRFLLPAILLLLTLAAVMLMPVPSSQAAGLLTRKAICLDPGHGGSDPRATNVAYGLLEKSINLDVSIRVSELLTDQGAKVFMTRKDDESYLTNSDRYTYCNDMQAKYALEEMILVSVHTNSVVDITWDGAMTLYGPREDPDLAQAIHDVMYPYLRETAPEGVAEFRDFGVDKFASGVLFKSNMPAAMVEPLFMSNSFEAPLLVQPIYDEPADESPSVNDSAPCRRGQIAQAVFAGISHYFAKAQSSPMHVAGIDMVCQQSRALYTIITTILIQDENGEPVSGASVTLNISKPDGSFASKIIITGNDGLATYSLRTKTTGEFIATIIDVSKVGTDYWSGSNVETSESLTIAE
jgi:N-acetylmuramoyl-L-alanine amidase